MTWVVPVRAEGHHGLLPGEKQQLSEAGRCEGSEREEIAIVLC